MDVSTFMDLFSKELRRNSGLHSYYKPDDSNMLTGFRKAYIEQRLQYIRDHIPESPCCIWDAGCGFSTTGIFLALNGYKVFGNTLEHYYDLIEKRMDYWSQFGDLTALTVRYENLYDMPASLDAFDVILLQDTLHHLEPVDQAANIFYRKLKPEGRLLVVEENGDSIFIILKNFLKRGFRTTSEHFDERLGKNILMGHEHARGFPAWLEILHRAGFSDGGKEVEYIRFFPPCLIHEHNYKKRIRQEREIARKYRWIMRYLCFGINFTLIKPYQ